ncbi:MAG: glycosyltransferase [Coriobacteriia bacterium]|nr:glycosyltransferase [Coriobacteriia bacterium]
MSQQTIENPLFSVFIPTFNRAYALPTAIDSVLAQTYTNFEILVVDDHSTDNTDEVLAQYDDPRVRILRHKINSGVQSGYNTAIDNMRGEWLVPLGSTKFLDHNTLQIIKEHMHQIPTDVKRILYGAANIVEGDLAHIEAGYSSGIISKDLRPRGDTGSCSHVDLLKQARPVPGINGFECEWNWRLRKASKEYYIDEVLYFCTRTPEGNHLSHIFDNGTALMSAADQRVLYVKKADPQFFIERYAEGTGENVLARFVNHCEALEAKRQANYIRRYARRLNIPVVPRPAGILKRSRDKAKELAQDSIEILRQSIVDILRFLRLKPPAPADEVRKSFRLKESDKTDAR